MEYNKEMGKAEIERDVFIDLGEQVIANFSRYIIEKEINHEDNDNPVVRKWGEAVDLVDKTYRFSSVKEVEDAYVQLDEIRRFYRELQ